QRLATDHDLEAVVVRRVVAAGDRDAATGPQLEAAEIHHWRRHHADVDDVAAGLAQAFAQPSDEIRTRQPAVTADDDVGQALFEHQRTDRVADQFGDAGVERLADDAADVVGAEDAAIDVDAAGADHFLFLHFDHRCR